MKIFRFFLFLFALIILFVVLLIAFIHPFLSIDKPVQSENLVIEAWLSGHELERIIEKSKPYNLEKIFVVGKKFEISKKNNIGLDDFESDEYFRWRKNKENGALLLTNSSLLIDLLKLGLKKNDSIKSISINMSDTQQNNVYAHFNASLNGEWLGSSFVSDSIKEYTFLINARFMKNWLLSLYFDNDYQDSIESRNLYIQSVKINETEYKLDESNSIITRDESETTNGFDSEAAQTIQYLKDLEVTSEIIEIVEFEKNGNNQTLASALKLKEYFGEIIPQNLNVSSAGLHGRRTLFTYQKILEVNQIGVFNVPVKKFDESNWYKSGQGIQIMLDEFFSYIYVWFYLNFV